MKVAIIGCGHMGSAIAERLSPYNQLFLYDHHSEKVKLLEDKGFGKGSTLNDALHQCEVLFLAIKPQNLKEASLFIRKGLRKDLAIVSILAGTSVQTLSDLFPGQRVFRMMPNLALIYGKGLIGLTTDERIDAQEKKSLADLCMPFGKVMWMPEEKMDAFTALASSGPAFVFTIVEAMIEAGIGMGLTAKDSQMIVQNMIHGSITVLDQTGKHPGELKWQVASPGGTTIAGLQRLEEKSVRSGIIQTFLAAYERSREMSRS